MLAGSLRPPIVDDDHKGPRVGAERGWLSALTRQKPRVAGAFGYDRTQRPEWVSSTSFPRPGRSSRLAAAYKTRASPECTQEAAYLGRSAARSVRASLTPEGSIALLLPSGTEWPRAYPLLPRQPVTAGLELLAGRAEQDLVDIHVLRLAHGEHHHVGEGVGGQGDPHRFVDALRDVGLGDTVR